MTSAQEHPASAHWASEIEKAAGERLGDAGARREFALAVVGGLEDAYRQGRRWENAFDTNRIFLEQIDGIREALFHLYMVIDAVPEEGRVFSLTREDLRCYSAPLVRFLDQTEEKWELESSLEATKPKRGRQIRTAIEITQMIAGEYFRHFRKRPGRSKQSDANNPFTRICAVVERILVDAGRTDVSLGYKARQEGTLRAGFDIACEKLGFCDMDVCAAIHDAGLTDPWQLLERDEKPVKSGLALVRGNVGRETKKRPGKRL